MTKDVCKEENRVRSKCRRDDAKTQSTPPKWKELRMKNEMSRT